MKNHYVLTPNKKLSFVTDSALAQTLKLNENFSVDLSNGQWNNKLLKMIAEHLLIWNPQDLNLNGNRNSSILKQMRPIGFPKLIKLSLWLNNISSIEGLCQIRMPTLQLLLLASNDISNISALRKTSFSLTWVELYDNPIINASILSSVNTSKNMFGFVFEDYRSNEMSSDIRWLAKIKAKSVLKLFINNEERIVQLSALKMLKKKYKSMRIFLDNSDLLK